MSARSRRACLLTVLGAGGRCSGARVGLVMAGVGPLWRKIGGQEDVRGACEHRQALFLVPRGACGPGGAAGAEGGACYVRQVRAWGGGNNRVAVTVAGPGQPPHMRWAGGRADIAAGGWRSTVHGAIVDELLAFGRMAVCAGWLAGG